MPTRVSSTTFSVTVTPTLDTAAYASGDRMGSVMHLANACGDRGRAATLLSIAILDKSDQKKAFTILFFDREPTVTSADNAAIDISDAEMEKCVGHITVASTDYFDAGGAAVATIRASSSAIQMHSKSSNGDLWAVLVAGDSNDYDADSLIITYKFIQEL